MKKIAALSLVLQLAGTSFAGAFIQAANPVESFWQAFKTAVIKRDVETVARLSNFPIGMSYGIPTIKTKAQVIKRYLIYGVSLTCNTGFIQNIWIQVGAKRNDVHGLSGTKGR